MKLYDVIKKEDEARGKVLPEPEVERPHQKPPHEHRRFSLKKVGIIAGAIVLLALLYILGIQFVHAKISVAERRIPFTLNKENFDIPHDEDKERLSFQTMVVTTEITREVFGEEARASTSRARGQVIFFNEYSTKAVTIKSGTTLTASNGKRYTTQSSASIPGYTMSGKLKKPGTSQSVPIIAVDTGSSYNTEGATFTVAGYTAKQINARTAGPITGGEAGAVHAVSEADKPGVVATLQAYLTERLKRETRAQIPDDFITYSSLQFVTIDANSMKLEGPSIKFPARLKGTMVSYLIPRDALETAIANAVLTQRYASVSIPALEDLVIEPVTAIPTNPSVTPTEITVTLSGGGTIIAKVPVERVKESLVGKPRKTFSEALSSITEIDSARYRLIPFWAPLFPRSEEKIKVEIK